MNETRRKVLVIGLVLLAICALFPPRRYAGNTLTVNNSTVAPRAFLWHQRLHQLGTGGGAPEGKVEIDTAKMLAEFSVIISLTGAVLIYCRR